MTNKEVKYGNAFRKLNRRKAQKKQPFPKIYATKQEGYELFESDEDQIKAVMVDTGLNFSK